MSLNLLLASMTIFHLTEAVTVECRYDFHNFEILGNSRYTRPFVSDAYRCEGRLSKNCDTNRRVIGVTRNHAIRGKTLSDVRYLSFENQFIPNLPFSLTPFFSEIAVLSLVRIQLREINAKDLKFPRLKFLSMRNNRLESLPGNLFTYTHDLMFLDVSDNPLSTVPSDLFDYLGNMKIVFIYDTKCMGSYLDGIYDVNDDPRRMEDLKRHLEDYCAPSMFGSLFSLMEEVGDDKYGSKSDDLEDYYIQDLRIVDRGRTDCSEFMLLKPGSLSVGSGIVEMKVKELIKLLN